MEDENTIKTEQRKEITQSKKDERTVKYKRLRDEIQKKGEGESSRTEDHSAPFSA